MKPLFFLFYLSGICPRPIETQADDNQLWIAFADNPLIFSIAYILAILTINIASLYCYTFIMYFNIGSIVEHLYNGQTHVNLYSDSISFLVCFLNFLIFFLISFKYRPIHCRFLNLCIAVVEMSFCRPFCVNDLLKYNFSKTLWSSVAVIATYVWLTLIMFQLKIPLDVTKKYFFMIIVGYNFQYQSILIFVAYIRFFVMPIFVLYLKLWNISREFDERTCYKIGNFNHRKNVQCTIILNDYLKLKRKFEKCFASQFAIILMHSMFSIGSATFSIIIRQYKNVSAVTNSWYFFFGSLLTPVTVILVLVWTLQRFGLQVIVFFCCCCLSMINVRRCHGRLV